MSFQSCSVAADGTYTISAADSSIIYDPANPKAHPGDSQYPLVSAPFTITLGPPSQIVFTQQPGSAGSNNPTGGTAFPSQPIVTIEDAGGNPIPSDSSTVQLSITSGTPSSGGPGTLSGCSQSEANGAVSFSGCTINTTGQNYSLTASDTEGGTTLTATSATFNVNVGAATHLAFTTSPSASTSAVAFGTQPVVTVEDAGGNTVSTNSTSVSLAIASQPGSGASFSSCFQNPVTTSNGVATFSNCRITNGTNEQGAYTLKATATGVTGATSTPFTVAGSAAKLAFSVSPTASTSGGALTTQPVVWVEDSSGDLVTTASNSITLAIGTQPTSGATFSSCSQNPRNATNGIATFSGCKITNASGEQGSYTLSASSSGLTTTSSSPFTVAGNATKLVFTQQPASSTGGVAFPSQPQVTIEDSSGDVVTTNTSGVTLAITSGTGSSGRVSPAPPT